LSHYSTDDCKAFRMIVLSVASEVFPLVKTGGLADVAGALPAALKHFDVEMVTLMPGYPAVMQALEKPKVMHSFSALMGGSARLLRGRAKGLDLIALDAPHLFNRPGNPYLGPDGKDWPDNAERYAALCLAAAELARGVVAGFRPDLVHGHDWQAGLLPAYLRYGGGPRSVMTVHNMAFQGNFPVSLFERLGLPVSSFNIEGVEYFGGVGFLKAGLACADAITTVSPTYAREILRPDEGMGLDGLLRARSDRLHGITNGIDMDVWNPATDPHISAQYDAKTLTNRKTNKRAVEQRFGLEQSDGLLFCIISRLTLQKGMDLLGETIDELVQTGARLAVLGSGDSGLENTLRQAATIYDGKVGMISTYDEPLSHLLQAGSDAIIIPSRFEPCGLTQLYGLRYGCVPVVTRVGGLADTVIDANEAAISAGVATGIQCLPGTSESLLHGLARTATLYADQNNWQSLQKAGMASDVSWTRSAGRYADLYKSLVKA
jgi:starch synthase